MSGIFKLIESRSNDISTDWSVFWTVFLIMLALVALQGFESWHDGRFSQKQMDRSGVTNSWSYLQHGGMWADACIISGVVAYTISKYDLTYRSWSGFCTLVFSAGITLALLEFYRRMGVVQGDHCTHDGRTTSAGIVHGMYAFVAIWVCLEVYLGLTTPIVSKADLLLITVWLTPFFYLGVKKFSPRWRMSAQDIWQISFLTAGIWVIAGYRLIYT